MENIGNILSEIAKRKNVRILYACETGSRAWGFPSPDSDYDIRFIYMHDRDWYLSLSNKKDTIEVMQGDLDITGWDLRKCMLMLKKSNAPLIERFQSPIGYFAEDGFKDEFKELISACYSPTAVFYHHYSLARKFQVELKDKEEIRLKNYFYLIRSLLSCHWIIKDRTVLPMNIEDLMSFIEDGRRNKIRKLISLKAGVDEKYLHPKDNDMDEWIAELWRLIESNKDGLAVCKTDFSVLNSYFLKKVNAGADN